MQDSICKEKFMNASYEAKLNLDNINNWAKFSMDNPTKVEDAKKHIFKHLESISQNIVDMKKTMYKPGLTKLYLDWEKTIKKSIYVIASLHIGQQIYNYFTSNETSSPLNEIRLRLTEIEKNNNREREITRQREMERDRESRKREMERDRENRKRERTREREGDPDRGGQEKEDPHKTCTVFYDKNNVEISKSCAVYSDFSAKHQNNNQNDYFYYPGASDQHNANFSPNVNDQNQKVNALLTALTFCSSNDPNYDYNKCSKITIPEHLLA